MKDGLASSGEKPYYDLGGYQRDICTTSEEARTWFNRGLVWCYSFHHEAATQCFETAVLHDPNCAMAYWGIAYALGPNYNKTWRMFTPDDREASLERILSALAQADKLLADAPPLERALITALTARFPRSSVGTPQDLSPFDYAYAEAMRPVYQTYGDDPEVMTLFADAVMCTRPRQLWDLNTGETRGKDVDEARAALERGLARADGRNHPGMCHLYIHMMEMSPFPEVALVAADTTHIDTACGDYRRSIDSNFDAVRADDKYFSRGEAASLIYNAYRSHNLHAMAYSAMMSGRSAEALYAARRLPDVLTMEFMSIKTPRMVDWTEWQLVTLPHTLIRFGHWDEILELQTPADTTLLCVLTVTVHYAKGIALAILGRVEEASRARDAFEEACQLVPADRMYSPTSAAEPVLAVASAMLEGELEYRKGNHCKAFSALRHGIELEDNLAYADPPLWMQPVRHALSALLLEQGRSDEAEKLYLEDLGLSDSHPRRKARINNVWGLHGLYECFVRNGKEEKAKSIRLQRDIAMASADITIKASCFCRLSALNGKNGCHST